MIGWIPDWYFGTMGLAVLFMAGVNMISIVDVFEHGYNARRKRAARRSLLILLLTPVVVALWPFAILVVLLRGLWKLIKEAL